MYSLFKLKLNQLLGSFNKTENDDKIFIPDQINE